MAPCKKVKRKNLVLIVATGDLPKVIGFAFLLNIFALNLKFGLI